MADNLLTEYRQGIDNMSSAVIFMLAERLKVTPSVGALNAARGLPPADTDREDCQVVRWRQLAIKAQMDPDFFEEVLRFIVTEVIRHHERLAHAHPRNEAIAKLSMICNIVSIWRNVSVEAICTRE